MNRRLLLAHDDFRPEPLPGDSLYTVPIKPTTPFKIEPIELSVLNKQVGGDHYKQDIQPVEYIKANNLDFFEGSVVKYITRWRKKGGVEDLKKAVHYLEMLIEFETTERVEP